jgi:hypothetical protein
VNDVADRHQLSGLACRLQLSRKVRAKALGDLLEEVLQERPFVVVMNASAGVPG